MIKKTLSLILVCLTAFLFGCGGQTTLLPHYDGTGDTFDSDVFYRNDLTLFGGDSDVIWVPEDRDEEYGGWFYQYTSGNGGVYTQWFDDDRTYAFSVLRSRNLTDWEVCGRVDKGFAVEITRTVSGGNPVLSQSDYILSNCWAPEVIYDDATGWYVMYASALSYRNDGKDESVTYSSSQNGNDRNYGSIFISDNPIGPFRLADSTVFYGSQPKGEAGTEIKAEQRDGDKILNLNGEEITRVNPAFDVTKYFKSVSGGKNAGIDFDFGMIDLSPFVDEDGTMYVYFAKHWLSEKHYLDEDEPDFTPKEENRVGKFMSIWGMRMKDAITPDYETLRMITFPNYLSVEYNEQKNGPVWLETSYIMRGYHDNTSSLDQENPDWEDHLNEGPQMSVHTSANGEKRYYLTYSQNSFYARDYGVHQALSTSPLGTFKKEGRTKSALGVEIDNDYMTGVGHHALVEAGGESFCVYWVHSDPFDTETSQYNGRAYAFDRIYWQYDETLGVDLMYGNGPTASLQFLPDIVTGYENIAPEAKITAKGAADENTVKYLNDEKVVSLDHYAGLEYRAKGETTITLTFDKPRSVRAIAIYNSYGYDYAFSGIDEIEFDLAEKPAFAMGNYNGKVAINDLPFNKNYFDDGEKLMRRGGASVASFDEIKVNSIKVTISKKLNGKKGEIRVSDIRVLGR